MALQPAVIGRRYAPLLLLLAVQIALVFIAPSTPPSADTGPASPAVGQSGPVNGATP